MVVMTDDERKDYIQEMGKKSTQSCCLFIVVLYRIG